ncbi:MAG: ATP-binding protein, partial [Spirochaetota bacterium]
FVLEAAIIGYAIWKHKVFVLNPATTAKSIVSIMSDALLLAGPDGKIMSVNPALTRLLGYAEGELAGRPLAVVFEPKGEHNGIACVQACCKDKDFINDLEAALKTKYGEMIPVSLSASKIVERNGKVGGCVFICRDIRERKEAEARLRLDEQQLVQADKMASLGVLVAGVSHEINNPNQFIMSSCSLVEKAWESVVPILEEYYKAEGDFSLGGINYSRMREKLRVYLGGIRAGAERIDRIIRDLKGFARQEEGVAMVPVEINAVVESGVNLLLGLIKQSTKHFEVSYGEGLPGVMGNYQQLEQVVINLIQNACQALKRREAGIRVRTNYDRRRGWIEVVVEDEGEGIKKEDLPRITDPFFSTKREAGGTGLGLAVSALIVKRHGGFLEFSSEAGEGTRAILILPVDAAG